jgi:hypothetical protein
VASAQALVAGSKTKASGFSAQIKTTCDTEIASIKALLAEAQAQGGNDLKQQKQKLADALEGRVKGLDDLLAYLKKLEEELKNHVARVNTVYSTRHSQYVEDMSAASGLLKEMGLLVQVPGSPEFKKITLANYATYRAAGKAGGPMADTATTAAPATPAPDAPGAQRFRGVAGKPASLLELSRSLTFRGMMEVAAQQAAAAGKTPPECSAAWEATFALYKATYESHNINDAVFEKERIALNRYLKLLRELTAKKKAKRDKLKEQLDHLKKVMGAPEEDVAARIAAALKEHQDLITAACPQMATLNADATKKKDDVVAKMQVCAKGDFGRPAAEGSAGSAPMDVVPAAGHTLVSGTVTHVPGESGTGNMEPMDVVPAGTSAKPVLEGHSATVAIPAAKR